MADSIISIVAERITAIIEEQVGNEINLVIGVGKEVLDLSFELKNVQNVLDDADRRGFKDESIKAWLKRLENASYEMDEVLDEWNIYLLKHQVCRPHFNPHSSCSCFKKVAVGPDIALKIKNVKVKLDEILKEKIRCEFLENQRTDSFGKLGRVPISIVERKEVQEREIYRDNLVSKITSHSTSTGQGEKLGPIHITAIVGMGGIGKTTLAQLVYHDNRIKDCFPLRIWICVSEPFDEAKIAKEIVEKERGIAPSTDQLQVLLENRYKPISEKKFLLVLDGVGNDDDTKWVPLKSSLKFNCAPGSRILVTTRNESVAKNIGTPENEIHYLEQLSDDECWSILSRIAFFDRSEEKKIELSDIGRKIAKRCKGLPLAAKTVGSLLRFKKEWEDVLNSEIWQLDSTKVDMFPHLLLSYNDLSLAQKRCFTYCALFPKDNLIDVDDLIRKWMALGYLSSGGGNTNELELRGREYFDDLANRSLFQNFETDHVNKNVVIRCKMHDVVREFAQFVRKGDLKSSDDRVEATMSKDASSCKTCSPSLVSHIKEYRSLFLDGKTHSDLHVCDCLASVRVLEFRNFRNMSNEVEKLIHLRYLLFSEVNLNGKDIKIICMLYNLQTLLLTRCRLGQIPNKIGNLTQLRHLNLSHNRDLKELPGVSKVSVSHAKLPHGLAKLTSLQALKEFYGGSDWSKLGLLEKLNRLRSLSLVIKLVDDEEDDIVKQARKAELRKKMHLQELGISFHDNMDEENNEDEVTLRKRLEVLDALEPHPNLQYLTIQKYMGSKFPDWIASPVHELRRISLAECYSCSSLPHLGKLKCLEDLVIECNQGFRSVGRDFLGITSSASMTTSSLSSIGFPRLKKLTFSKCFNWEDWQDITVDEEKSDAVSVMPCLTEMQINNCESLMMLPQRLLRKASSLQKLIIYGSTQLLKYKKDPLKEHTSHIPEVIFRGLPYGSEKIPQPKRRANQWKLY